MESKEKCGIIGFCGNTSSIYEQIFCLMNAIQHRGQEGCGISFWKNNSLEHRVSEGLVIDLFKTISSQEIEGSKCLIAHTRYSTTGSNNITNIQPFISKSVDGKTFALAHNGNIVNALELKEKLKIEGHTFNTTSDSEVILHTIINEYNKSLNIQESILKSIEILKGAFSIVMMMNDTLIAFRDKHGFRPLVYGFKDKAVFVASEDSALRNVDIQDFKEVEPGEIIFFSEGYTKKIQSPLNGKLSHCIFELIYFSKPSSNVFGTSVYNFRYISGRLLGRSEKTNLDADFVVPIPDSGLIAAIGYAEETKIPLAIGLVRNHFSGRSFINPTQTSREMTVKTKFFVSDVIKNKTIVLVDDSIVRGTTMKKIVNFLKKNGVSKLHLRIASPPVRYPCFFGIDFPDPRELIATKKSLDEIKSSLDIESIRYLELKDMMSTLDKSKSFCNACFSGEYPINIHIKLDKRILEGKTYG